MAKPEFSTLGLAHKVFRAAEAQGYTPELLNALAEHPALFRQLLEVQQGRASVVLFEKKPEPVLDTIIRVDRSIRPIYPDWVKTVIHPELELTGPVEYDLNTIQSSNREKNGSYTTLEDQYCKYVKKNRNILESCLSLRDGEEIRKKGTAVFRKFFRGRVVFLWKSVVQSRDGGFGGDFHVPCFYENGGQVMLVWCFLGCRANSAISGALYRLPGYKRHSEESFRRIMNRSSSCQ